MFNPIDWIRNQKIARLEKEVAAARASEREVFQDYMRSRETVSMQAEMIREQRFKIMELEGYEKVE